jgi:ribosome-associated heat shock protein Hsp15
LLDERQRIDKWLWHARVVRTRAAAAELAQSGHVRLNGARVDTSSRAVKPGDVVTVALDHRVRVLKVVGFSLRRGPPTAGRQLYEDLSPAPADQDDKRRPPEREPGGVRPTKQERRAIVRFTRRDDL